MNSSEIGKILSLIAPTDKVLDVGGWACPFNRADWVIDSEPFETRGFYRNLGLPAHQGPDKESFSSNSWIQRDLCDRNPYPFPDKFFDFSICSHTLEDTRDPLFICSELIRISKRGYIEVPSRLVESSRGWESSHIAGLSHHRWLIDIQGKHIQFTQKFHAIHSHFDLSFPPSFLHRLRESERNTALYWNGSFTFAETTIHGLDEQLEYLRSYIRLNYRYPQYRYWVSRSFKAIDRMYAGIKFRLKKHISRREKARPLPCVTEAR